jgi:ankyrin repeat protein
MCIEFFSDFFSSPFQSERTKEKEISSNGTPLLRNSTHRLMSTAFDEHIKSILQSLSASIDGVHVDPLLRAIQANDRHTLRILIRAGYSLHTIDLASGRSLLHVATHLGHTAVAKRLLNEGIDPSLSDRDGKTSLHLAAARGFSRLLTLLLHYETHVEYPDNDNNTPLHLSCQFGHNECCRLLVYAGANLDSTNREGDTPLHSAVRFKHAGLFDRHSSSFDERSSTISCVRLYSNTHSCGCVDS